MFMAFRSSQFVLIWKPKIKKELLSIEIQCQLWCVHHKPGIVLCSLVLKNYIISLIKLSNINSKLIFWLIIAIKQISITNSTLYELLSQSIHHGLFLCERMETWKIPVNIGPEEKYLLLLLRYLEVLGPLLTEDELKLLEGDEELQSSLKDSLIRVRTKSSLERKISNFQYIFLLAK